MVVQGLVLRKWTLLEFEDDHICIQLPFGHAPLLEHCPQETFEFVVEKFGLLTLGIPAANTNAQFHTFLRCEDGLTCLAVSWWDWVSILMQKNCVPLLPVSI